MSKIYKGIDISLYQGSPDFAKVAASGIDFVIHKAGQGGTPDYPHPFTDPKFEENVKAVCRTKMYQGAYWYLRAATEAEAKAEAEYFVKILAPYRFNLQLWAVCDVEDDRLPTDKAKLTKLVKIFCDVVKAAGYRPMVYSTAWWMRNRFDLPKGVPFWEARWGAKDIPDYAKALQVGVSKVPGIVGDMDTNFALDIIGDANGDGKVDAKDVAVMLKAIAGWKGVIDESQADIDRDGYVTAKDVQALLRELARN